MKKIWIGALIVTMGFVFFVESAMALRITLKRIVFEGSKRAEFITVINNGYKDETYRLEWKHFRMSETKGLVFVPEDELTDDIKPVVDMIRFAPRRFTVPAGGAQQIRIVLRTPSDLPDGEYRSHLWINPEADVEELRAKAFEQEKKNKGKSGVVLSVLTGATMPVIVRKGVIERSSSIVGLSAKGGAAGIDVGFDLTREGNASVYGDLDFICNPESDAAYTLKSVRGVAVYPEISKRELFFRIPRAQDQPACTRMSVTFVETDGLAGDRGEVYAVEKINVNQ